MQSKTVKQAHSLKKNLSSDAKRMVNKAEKKYNELKKEGTSMADSLERRAYEMGEKTKHAISQVEDLARTGADEVEAQIKTHPFITMGAAFLIGMLIGKLSK